MSDKKPRFSYIKNVEINKENKTQPTVFRTEQRKSYISKRILKNQEQVKDIRLVITSSSNKH